MDAKSREESARAVSATATIEGEARDLVGLETLSSAPAAAEDCGADNIAALIPKITAPPVAEFEKLMRDLEEAKKYLQSEGERVRREADRYLQLTQTASQSVRIISDAISEWRQSGHPLQ
jgi:hypothetical protein